MAGFNTPIPVSQLHRINEGSGLRSVRDKDSLGLHWKKTNITTRQSGSDNQVLSKVMTELGRLKRRQTGYMMSSPPMHPFKIYKMDNYGDASKSPLTYQIRGGVIGVRSNNWNGIGPYANWDGWPFYGNTEYPLYNFGTDGNPVKPDFFLPPTQNQGQSYVLVNGSDTEIPSFDVSSGNTQIVLNSDLDDGGNRLASFWLEVVDSPDRAIGIKLKLWGRMWAGAGDSTGRPQQAFPNPSQTIFPLGLILLGSFLGYDSPTIIQYLDDNIIARYPIGGGVVNNPIYHRGLWVADSLSGTVFHNGDTVIDDSTTFTKSLSPSGSFAYNRIYTYKSTSNAETQAPNTRPDLWVYTGVYL